MNKEILSVTELNTYIKNLLQKDNFLMHVHLQGELRDFKKSISGHYYFSLIDENSSISAMLFSFNTHCLKGYRPKDGDQVEVTGSINVYIKGGRYSINVTSMCLAGMGAKLLALKKLQDKLAKEGLFSRPKRIINRFPNNIGIITAKNSAASQDLLINIFRRFPLVNVYAFYSSVQGVDAPKELIAALNKAYAFTPKLDTIIIARGGGSNEDLEAFNDEGVVRAAFASPIPLIAAIGHEIDFTLVEYVADQRASTPTGAAEYATVDKFEIYETLNQYSTNMVNNLLNRLKNLREKINLLKNRPFFVNPSSIYADKQKDLKLQKDNLKNAMQIYLTNKTSKLVSLKEKLNVLNPNNVLNRGFAMLKSEKGKIIKHVDDVHIDEEIKTTLVDGTIYVKVKNKEKHV